MREEKGTQIWFNGYYTTSGSTKVSKFWGDIHDLDFRSKKVIWNMEDLKEQTEQFEKDRELYDWTSYASHAKNHKAKEEYFSLVEDRKDFMEITFEYDGKVYRTRTSKWSVSRDIEKKAAKILKWVDVQTISLMRDDNNELISIIKEIGKVNHLLDDFSNPEDVNDYIR